ncbi:MULTISPECIES: trypsin-like peptidase domain-containing protein [unclassified Pseudomonas]|uniref:trypsin-like peptidase domain-containing protein n=1 Tax=unclassified Pseudomonas TaxID=196821 RepID=UPI0012950966|nr:MULTISPECIES: trypsin-like peptidase domain-containing protein [unclassified Pseudomonas]MQU09723.1 trypsin [Pseudomonas sp. FSL R10-2189]MQU36169.1 trypsin [Pseudomonas sp. FSL R10-2172]
MLTPGANIALSAPSISWTLESSLTTAFGSTAAVALIPVDDKRNSKGEAALFHVEQSKWMFWSGDPSCVGSTIHLDRLPGGSDRVLMVVYRYSNLGPIGQLKSLKFTIEQHATYDLDVSKFGDSALILGEFYTRQGQWKFRALAEGSAYGLSAFGRRIGLDIDEANPDQPSAGNGSSRPNGSPTGATGTGFAVSETAIITCAHVIEGMSDIEINSFNGRYRAEPVMVDTRNDMALLRVKSAQLVPVRFAPTAGCSLGDPVTAVGFPMSGFAGGGAHVTQGGVSALFGLRNDASLMQFTAAIQPGSSGSPLFDVHGSVVGMVTSTVPDAQNMNFAVKSNLLVAFLDACHISIFRNDAHTTLTAADIARGVQPSLWKIEARS